MSIGVLVAQIMVWVFENIVAAQHLLMALVLCCAVLLCAVALAAATTAAVSVHPGRAKVCRCI